MVLVNCNGVLGVLFVLCCGTASLQRSNINYFCFGPISVPCICTDLGSKAYPKIISIFRSKPFRIDVHWIQGSADYYYFTNG
jgi:hypothetical protein